MADHDFDGTNPLLEALGDESTVRDVTLFNQSYKKIIEPLTGVHIQPGQTAVIRVTGDAAFNTIKGNVDQLKALKDYDVLAMSVDVVDEQPDGLTLTNATYDGAKLVYTDGTIDFNWPYNSNPALSLTKPLAENEEFSFELPSYDIGGLNPVSEVLIFISSHDTVIDAFNDRPMFPTPPATPTVALWDFTQNGSNSGLSIVSPEDPESEYPRTDLILKTLVKADVIVSMNSVAIEMTDKQTNEVTTHEAVVPELMSTPKYLHVVLILNAENLPDDLSLIQLPLVVAGSNPPLQG